MDKQTIDTFRASLTLTPTQVKILIHLVETGGGGLTQGHLARVLQRDPLYVGRMLMEMAVRNIVSKKFRPNFACATNVEIYWTLEHNVDEALAFCAANLTSSYTVIGQ